jgi:hypothetical protein
MVILSLLRQPATYKTEGWVQNELPKVAVSTLYSLYGITTQDNNPETSLIKQFLFLQ